MIHRELSSFMTFNYDSYVCRTFDNNYIIDI